MEKLSILIIALLITLGCKGNEEYTTEDTSKAPSGVEVQYTAPEPLEVPESMTAKSDTDWEAKVHNKEIEVIQVLNILNPIAAYITAGFEQYGSQIKNQTVHEEWQDTQAQLTQALELYDACKKRKASGEYNKQLFLDLEHTWQILVKTGVAGVRTKQMLDEELSKLSS